MLDSGSISTVGQIVSDYELLRRIGGGAYGEVWLARSKATGVLRAAKIVWRHTFDDERPFEREFEGIRRFEQVSRQLPSQLALFHIGRDDAKGCFYYVMELADDVENRLDAESYSPRTLRADLQHGRLAAGRVLEIGIALAEALGNLHRNGLIHRDVKPSNVIFVNGCPKLADIGLVTDASDTRSIVGTEGYLPPEGPGTPQGDLFALGKVLYEAVTGLDRREFPKLPPDLRGWPEAKQVFELNEILLKACAANLRERYGDVETMLGELALLREGKSLRRRRTMQWYWAAGKKAGAALIAPLVIAVVLLNWPRQPGRSEPSSDGPDSTNLEANALCDKAMYIMRGENVAEIQTAYSNFIAAAAMDHNFVRPYVGLLEMEIREDVPGAPLTTKDSLREVARNLERLAPRHAATYVAQSAVNWTDWNYPEALDLALRATKANPTYELGHTWYSWLLLCFGRPEEARKQVEISRALAPSQTIIYHALGNIESEERHWTNAIQWYKTSIKWEPHHTVPYNGIARAYQALGDYTNALEYFEEEELLEGANRAETTNAYRQLRNALAEGGASGYWRKRWEWTVSDPNKDCYAKAIIQIHLGETNAALHWLQRAYEIRERWNEVEAPLSLLLCDEYWDGVRDDPRFQELLDKIGFSKVMPPRAR